MFPQLVKDYLFEDSALADRHGYEPLTGVMSADAMISEGGSEVEADSLKIQFLESLIHETKEMGVRMVAVYSPYYHSVPESEDDKGLLKEIFEREQIPYFDFRCDDRFSSHPELFEDRFHAYVYGPVMVSIRSKYKNGTLNVLPTENEIAEYITVFDSVFANYAGIKSWSLSTLSHGEESWQKARVGLNEDEKGNSLMSNEDIRHDAKRIKVRRYLLSKISM